MEVDMTREEAHAHVSMTYGRVVSRTMREARCYAKWTETWTRRDGVPPTPRDVEAFDALPRGQGHQVSIVDGQIVLVCELDTSD